MRVRSSSFSLIGRISGLGMLCFQLLNRMLSEKHKPSTLSKPQTSTVWCRIGNAPSILTQLTPPAYYRGLNIYLYYVGGFLVIINYRMGPETLF